MPYTSPPKILRSHLVHEGPAKLYADRFEMLCSLAPKGGVYCEIGVALAGFAVPVMDAMSPSLYVAVDLFEMHHIPMIWGRTSEEVFGGKTHEEYFRERMQPYGERVVLKKGHSHDVMKDYPPEYFDCIYIDAGHMYEGVKTDAVLSADCLKVGGLMFFNDYTLWDPAMRVDYGVVHAANELVVQDSRFKIAGMALDPNMFCDLALVKERA